MKLLDCAGNRVLVEMSQEEFDAIYKTVFTLDSFFGLLDDNPYNLTEDLIGHCGDQLEDVLEDVNEAQAARRAS